MKSKPSYEDLLKKIGELEHKQQRLQNTFDYFPIGFVVHAADSSILISNQEAHRILGLSREQMEGKKAIAPAWKFVHEDGSTMKVEDYPVSKVISSKKSIDNYILGIIKPNVEKITWVDVKAIPKLDQNNNITEIYINFIDITNLKEKEIKLKESYEELITAEEELRSTNEELSATSDELRVKNLMLKFNKQLSLKQLIHPKMILKKLLEADLPILFQNQ